MTYPRLFAAGTSLLALTLSAAAMAQTTGQADRQNAQAGTTAPSQDIIVTATRREETVLKAPLSITAYSQASLDVKGVRNVEDLVRMTPGLGLREGGLGVKFIVIRGLQSAVGATMNGIYIDDTPIQVRSISIATNWYPASFDLERIEVLRGPQGTTFGSGAMGGAIRYISAKPSVDKYSGYARAEIGSTEGGALSYEGGAAVGGPIVQDKIGFRVSGYYRRDGGYIDRVPYVADTGSFKANANSRNTYSGQAQLLFKPTENLSITPGIYYQNYRRNADDQSWTQRPGLPAFGTTPVGPTPPPLNPTPYPKFTSGEGGAAFLHDRNMIYSVKASLDLGFAELVSNSSILDRKIHSNDDTTAFFSDLISLPQGTLGNTLAGTINLNGVHKSFTQEVRLQSKGGGRLNYEVGVFYQNSRQTMIEKDFALDPATSNLGPTYNNTIGLAIDHSVDKQIAGFAQVDYKLFDKLKLTAGVRYSKLSVDFTNQTGFGFTSPTIVNGTPVPADVIVGGKTKEKPWTPKFGAEYQMNDRMMIYASAAKGFRPGGPNAGGAIVNCKPDLDKLGLTAIPPSYNSDSVWSYEVGAKGRPSRFLEFAADVFQLDWKNQQRAYLLTSCSQNIIMNVGSSRVRGFEGKFTIYPARGLSIDTNLSYTDAKAAETIPNFSLVNGVPTRNGNLSTKGDRFAPQWIISLAGDYETEIRNGVTGYGHIQWDHTSGYNNPTGNISYVSYYYRQFTRNLVAARVGARFHGIDASIFVNNLTNSKSELSRLALGNYPANRLLIGTYRPRTVGATVSYRY